MRIYILSCHKNDFQLTAKMKYKPRLTQLFLFLTLLLSFTSCYEDRCFDVQKISEYRKEAREWVSPDNSSNTQFTKNRTTPFLFSVTQKEGFSAGVSDSDDCGRTFIGFEKITSIANTSPNLNFQIRLKASGENEYYLALEILSPNPKSATYDFVSDSPRESNVESEIVKDYQLENIIYTEVMRFKFLDELNPNELKELFYAKGVGVIKFSIENGNEFITR
ncbi:MAG: hypothetical protein ACI85I_001983 [Arenicella sp.]